MSPLSHMLPANHTAAMPDATPPTTPAGVFAPVVAAQPTVAPTPTQQLSTNAVDSPKFASKIFHSVLKGMHGRLSLTVYCVLKQCVLVGTVILRPLPSPTSHLAFARCAAQPATYFAPPASSHGQIPASQAGRQPAASLPGWPGRWPAS